MRHKNSDTPFSHKAYYFGLISLVLFFVQGILKYTKTMSDRNAEIAKLPDFLLWLTLLVLLFTSLLCIFNAVRGIKETKTFKGIMGTLLAIGSLIFLLSMGVAIIQMD